MADIFDIIKNEKNEVNIQFEIIHMIEKGLVNPNKKNEKGENILMNAIYQRKFIIASFLTDIADDMGLDLNYQNPISSNLTALMYALRESACDLALQIIYKGANIHLVSTLNENALHWATPECPQVMKVLIKKGILGKMGSKEFKTNINLFLHWCRENFYTDEYNDAKKIIDDIIKND
jgi:ankyrin repeat protein